jgi:hypothetical protein
MDETREHLRTEFLAVLSAGRELDPKIHPHLADVFLDRVDAAYRPAAARPLFSDGGPILLPAIAMLALLAFLLGASLHRHLPPAVPAQPAYRALHQSPFGPNWSFPAPRRDDPGDD